MKTSGRAFAASAVVCWLAGFALASAAVAVIDACRVTGWRKVVLLVPVMAGCWFVGRFVGPRVVRRWSPRRAPDGGVS